VLRRRGRQRRPRRVRGDDEHAGSAGERPHRDAADGGGSGPSRRAPRQALVDRRLDVQELPTEHPGVPARGDGIDAGKFPGLREDPQRLRFEITARDGAARTTRLHLVGGTVATPAFIPLASHGSVRSLAAAEVVQLGFELVLGNTYHLTIRPGEEAIAALGGIARFMGWPGATITDSGGFQVFSLAHGGVADEIKGRGRARGGRGAVLEIAEEGVRFRSYLDGSERFLGPEESMRIQARLGSDIALTFDECTPFHADRDYTARSTARTHRWLERCVAWHHASGPSRQAIFGIVQGGIYEDLRRESAAVVAAAGVDGLAIGGTLGRDKEQMRDVVALTASLLPERAPRHLLGIGEPDDLVEGVANGVDLFDCAVPTRLARHGTALAPLPEMRYRLDLRSAEQARDEGPLVDSCPCAACRGHTRAYLHHLVRARELTAVRLLCVHNLTYLELLAAGARQAIAQQALGRYRAATLAGEAPWDAAAAATACGP
jgi:queuine tRNA-ribosyltransferase